MEAIIVFAAVLAVFIKTVSYGIWEIKRQNESGGIFSILLAIFCLTLAGRYLINYWA